MNNIIIKKPLVSEKSFTAASAGVYVFSISANANKAMVKEQVAKIFKVKVEKVNIVNIPGKIKRSGKKFGQRSNIKKAYVKLVKGQKITIFEEEKKTKKEETTQNIDTEKTQNKTKKITH